MATTTKRWIQRTETLTPCELSGDTPVRIGDRLILLAHVLEEDAFFDIFEGGKWVEAELAPAPKKELFEVSVQATSIPSAYQILHALREAFPEACFTAVWKGQVK